MIIMIYQGSNSPIRIWISGAIDDVTNMSIMLHDGNTDVKVWEYADLDIKDNKIYAPLTEVETLAFPHGKLVLEIKWSDKDGIVHLEPTRNVNVIQRLDSTVISTPVEPEDDSGDEPGDDPGEDGGEDDGDNNNDNAPTDGNNTDTGDGDTSGDVGSTDGGSADSTATDP